MILDGLALARALHILAIVHWIGGVAAVTMIILPHARIVTNPKEALAFFENFERPFARQVRISIALVGLSGIYMLYRLDAWDRFLYPSFWWLHLMVAVWIAFAIMVYVAEPLLLHRRFAELALLQKNRAFALIQRLHVIALLVSTIAVAAGVIGAHGGLP
jgi:uncharacterized membrane protein